MRAKRSWPRSSVPNGWSHDGGLRRAVKSISSIATCQSSGPTRIASASSASTRTLMAARRWRRNRRHASPHGEKRRLRLAGRGASGASTIGDTWVKPAIDDIGHQVEEDDETGEHERHRHDDGRVVGEDGADQERSDPGNAEDLLRNDGAAEHA